MMYAAKTTRDNVSVAGLGLVANASAGTQIRRSAHHHGRRRPRSHAPHRDRLSARYAPLRDFFLSMYMLASASSRTCRTVFPGNH